MIKYSIPDNWIKYDPRQIQSALVDAESSILALKNIPYQRDWVEKLQRLELKREIAGTSRIEGADFTERELDDALQASPAELITRSQRQAHAAVNTYRWIAALPDDRPVNSALIKEIHRRIVTGADDDHCDPGWLRSPGQNVDFGQPRRRGAEGGRECEQAFSGLTDAIAREFPGHPLILRGLAAHYHLAAMHPFLDGNGRTARALEALFLQRAGLRDTCFIAMSNYYYDEKIYYLDSLAASRRAGHDLTPFLLFALKGIARQVKRLLREIRPDVQKAVFRNAMYDLFSGFKSRRKITLAERQLAILETLLEREELEADQLYAEVNNKYRLLKNPGKAYVRDLKGLKELKAIEFKSAESGLLHVAIRLEWPTEITEADFRQMIK